MSSSSLVFTGDEMEVWGTSTVKSDGNMTIDTAVKMTSIDDVAFQTNESLLITKNISSDGRLELWSNANCEEHGVVTIGIDSIVSSPNLRILGNAQNVFE